MDRNAEWADAYGSLGKVSNQLTHLPLHILDVWTGNSDQTQPFKPYTPDRLQELADNIKVNGIIEPICVRPKGSRFEIIAGHNRVAAARLAGLTSVPALIQDLNDDQAAVLLVDSNLQHRDVLFPSEKAWAYRTKLEAIKRQGCRTDLTSAQLEPKLRSNETVAEDAGESRAQIQRYIRLTYLIQPLLDMTDSGKLKFTPAVDLSYLPQAEQSLLYALIAQETDKPKGPNAKQAKKLRQLSAEGQFVNVNIREILWPIEDDKPEQLKLSMSDLSAFFPDKTSPEIIKKIIFEALDAYRGHKRE